MKLRRILSSLSGVAGLVLFGCGGGSSSGGGGAVNTGSVFVGRYVGAFTTSGPSNDTGEFAIVVSSTGAITGRYINITAGSFGNTSAGQITFVSSTATTDIGSVSITDAGGTATGSLTLTGSPGTLTGSLTYKSTGLTITFSSGLVSTSNATANSPSGFAGFYDGTFIVNGISGSPSNSASMIVDVNGNITAFLTDNIAGQSLNTRPQIGTIQNSGKTSLGSSRGTLAITNGVLVGSLSNAGNLQTETFSLNANQ